jgi:hypothetical protein
MAFLFTSSDYRAFIARLKPTRRVRGSLAGDASAPTLFAVALANEADGIELVVGPDGSIPAEQLAPLGLGPGMHLRVLPGEVAAERLEGSMPEFPDLSWEDFQRGSDLAIRNVSR